MSNPTQHDVLDRMIARLEEANARSYKEPLRAAESSSKSDHDGQSAEQQVASNHRSSRAGPRFVALVSMLIAASVLVTSFAWAPSYLERLNSTIARWVNVSTPQTESQTPAQDAAVPPRLVRPEIKPRLERMADEITDLQQRIAQIQASQDQVSRSGADAAAQFKIDREQMMRDNANVADQLRVTQDQLKTTQAQLAEILSSELANSGRKFFRRRRLSALSQRTRARSSVR